MEDEADDEMSQSVTKLLQEFPNLENEEVDEPEFEVISKGISTDEEWTDLGKLLGLNEISINIIRYNFYAKGIQKTCLQMLRSWKQKRRGDANKKNLYESLFKIKREDIVAALTRSKGTENKENKSTKNDDGPKKIKKFFSRKPTTSSVSSQENHSPKPVVSPKTVSPKTVSPKAVSPKSGSDPGKQQEQTSPSILNQQRTPERKMVISSPPDSSELTFLFDLKSPIPMSTRRSPSIKDEIFLYGIKSTDNNISNPLKTSPICEKESIFNNKQETQPNLRITPKPAPRPSKKRTKSLPVFPRDLTDKMLREVSDNLNEDEWMELGKALKLSLIKLNVIKYNYLSKGSSESCFQMLISWRKGGTETWIPLLREALKEIDRNDLNDILDDTSSNKTNLINTGKNIPPLQMSGFNKQEENKRGNRRKRNVHYINEEDVEPLLEKERVPDTGEINCQEKNTNYDISLQSPKKSPTRISEIRKPIPSPRRLKPGPGLSIFHEKENQIPQPVKSPKEISKKSTLITNGHTHKPPRIVHEILKRNSCEILPEQISHLKISPALAEQSSKQNETGELIMPSENCQNIQNDTEIAESDDVFIADESPVIEDKLTLPTNEIDVNKKEDIVPKSMVPDVEVSHFINEQPTTDLENQQQEEIQITPKLEKHVEPSALNVVTIESLEAAILAQEQDIQLDKGNENIIYTTPEIETFVSQETNEGNEISRENSENSSTIQLNYQNDDIDNESASVVPEIELDERMQPLHTAEATKVSQVEDQGNLQESAHSLDQLHDKSQIADKLHVQNELFLDLVLLNDASNQKVEEKVEENDVIVESNLNRAKVEHINQELETLEIVEIPQKEENPFIDDEEPIMLSSIEKSLETEEVNEELPTEKVMVTEEEEVNEKLPTEKVMVTEEVNEKLPTEKVMVTEEVNEELPTEKVMVTEEVNEKLPTEKVMVTEEVNEELPTEKVMVTEEVNEKLPTEKVMVMEEVNEKLPTEKVMVTEEVNEKLPTEKVMVTEEVNEKLPTEKVMVTEEVNEELPTEKVMVTEEVNEKLPTEKVMVTEEVNEELPTEKVMVTEEVNEKLPTEKVMVTEEVNEELPTEKVMVTEEVNEKLPTEKVMVMEEVNEKLPTEKVMVTEEVNEKLPKENGGIDDNEKSTEVIKNLTMEIVESPEIVLNDKENSEIVENLVPTFLEIDNEPKENVEDLSELVTKPSVLTEELHETSFETSDDIIVVKPFSAIEEIADLVDESPATIQISTVNIIENDFEIVKGSLLLLEESCASVEEQVGEAVQPDSSITSLPSEEIKQSSQSVSELINGDVKIESTQNISSSTQQGNEITEATRNISSLNASHFISKDAVNDTSKYTPRTSTPHHDLNAFQEKPKTEVDPSQIKQCDLVSEDKFQKDPLSSFLEEGETLGLQTEPVHSPPKSLLENFLSGEICKENSRTIKEDECNQIHIDKTSIKEEHTNKLNILMQDEEPEEIEMEIFQLSVDDHNGDITNNIDLSLTNEKEFLLQQEENVPSERDTEENQQDLSQTKDMSLETTQSENKMEKIDQYISLEESQNQLEFADEICKAEPKENLDEKELECNLINEVIASENTPFVFPTNEDIPFSTTQQETISDDDGFLGQKSSTITEVITKLSQYQRCSYQEVQPFNLFWIQGKESQYEDLHMELNFRLEEISGCSRNNEFQINELFSSRSEKPPQRILVSEKSLAETTFLVSKIITDWLRKENYMKFSLLFFVDLKDLDNNLEELIFGELEEKGFKKDEVNDAVKCLGLNALIVLYSSVKMDEEAVEAVFSDLKRDIYPCTVVFFTPMRERFSPSQMESLQQTYSESELSELINESCCFTDYFWDKHVEVMHLSLSKRKEILQAHLNDSYERFLNVAKLANASVENIIEHPHFLTLLLTIMHKEEFEYISTHTQFYQQLVVFLTTEGAKYDTFEDHQEQILAKFGQFIYDSLKNYNMKLTSQFSENFQLIYAGLQAYCIDATILKRGILYQKSVISREVIGDNLKIIHENFIDYFIAFYLKSLCESDPKYEDFEIEMRSWFSTKINNILVSYTTDKPVEDSLMYVFLGGLLDVSHSRLMKCLQPWNYILPVNREPMISLLSEVNDLQHIASSLEPFFPKKWTVTSSPFFSSRLHQTLLHLGVITKCVQVLVWNPLDECRFPSDLKIERIILKFIVSVERKDLKQLQKRHYQNSCLANAELISNSILSKSVFSESTLNMSDSSCLDNISCEDLVLFIDNFSDDLWDPFMNIVNEIERRRLTVVLGGDTKSILRVLTTQHENLKFHSLKALEVIEEKGKEVLNCMKCLIRSNRIQNHLTIQIQNWKSRGCQDTRICMEDVEKYFSTICEYGRLKEFIFISDTNFETMVNAYINKSSLFNSRLNWTSLCIDGRILYKKDNQSPKGLTIRNLGLSDANNIEINASILGAFEIIESLKCSTDLFQMILPKMPDTWSGVVTLKTVHLTISKSKTSHIPDDFMLLPNLKTVCLDFQNIFNYSDASSVSLLKYPFLCVDLVIFKTVRSWNLHFIVEFIQDLILTKKKNYGDISTFSTNSDESDAALNVNYGPLLQEVRIWFDEKTYLKDNELKKFFSTVNSLLTDEEIVCFSVIEPNKFLKEIQSCFPSEENFNYTREIEDLNERETLFAHYRPIYSAEAPEKLVIKIDKQA